MHLEEKWSNLRYRVIQGFHVFLNHIQLVILNLFQDPLK